MLSRIFNKVKFLLICWYSGHRYGINDYFKNGNDIVCARCGFTKKRKKTFFTDDDFYIY